MTSRPTNNPPGDNVEIDDPFIAAGHPYTCNGGNADVASHHDHEVIMQRDGYELRCPECQRVQMLSPE